MQYMLPEIPTFVFLLFVFCTLLTGILFINAIRTNKPKTVIMFTVWLAVQTFLSLSLFYADFQAVPPRFLLAVVPTLIFILGLFFTSSGKQWMDQIDIKTITLVHLVRIPVEIGLFYLFVFKAIPEIMTFSSRNFDIIAGITAPVIYYFGFIKGKLSKHVILVWNVLSILLLVNIVVHAILSAPLPIQQFGFEQPNLAIFYFPYIWLPSFIVPVVLFSHLVQIRKLILQN